MEYTKEQILNLTSMISTTSLGLKSGLLLALLVGGLYVYSTQAASAVYSFVARGTISQFDETNKTIKVAVTKVDGKGKDDLEGNTTEFIIDSTAKVLKVASGKDARVTYHNLALGQEVAFKGVKKDNDTYVLSFIRINDRSFQIIGTLESLTKGTKTMKITVTSSTYKPTTYPKGSNITMTYTDDTVFRKDSTNISTVDLNADAQKVKVWGYIDGSTWKVTQLWNNYTGK